KAEAPKAEAPKAEAAPAPAAPKSDDGGRIFASPLARRLAAQAGLNLKALKGTGPRSE
ncbi:MAG TPA: pyruvate dehydrogenase complex dihydrolipoamide acetyltransferase, partial [Brevundimonas sp.]|nr:pyruvate dehydrogenase complex dihydrolipoamide acetyltransferase [Brevundimonas sp.]